MATYHLSGTQTEDVEASTPREAVQTFYQNYFAPIYHRLTIDLVDETQHSTLFVITLDKGTSDSSSQHIRVTHGSHPTPNPL